ncbi:TLC domain-containing protein At5g14285-like [Primulina huaijiensis]|uniref:TLC domain-containing protein At5g14285-like n=1 Tax=Primulina huaijiensis TaxID=1492673 RepID=UPI003CC72504
MMEDITNLPLALFLIMYFIIYLTAFFIFFWARAPDLRPKASSCSISLAHGTPAVFLSSYVILSDPSIHFHSPNSLQNLVLEYSIAYFLMDLLHPLVFSSTDVLYIDHHLCTLFVFLICRYVAYHGAFAILVLLILAEVTSFCQNLWTLAGARRSDLKFAAMLYDFLSPPFYAFYTIIRGFLASYFVYQMLVRGAGHGAIPQWVWISWHFFFCDCGYFS